MDSKARIYEGIRGGLLEFGTVDIEPGGVAGDAKEDTTVEVDGVETGDVVFMTAPSDLEDNLVFIGAKVTDDNEVTVSIKNLDSGETTGAEKTWGIVVLKTSNED